MSTSTKKIVLKSSDDMIFKVEEAVALESETIAHMIEVDCVANAIPLANVTGEILTLVIEYCKKHVVVADDDGGGGSSSSTQEDLKNWDAQFINDLDQSTIFNLILAANFLNIKTLLDFTCQFVADTMIKGKTVEEIRKTFNIENDFTAEEEAQIHHENEWAFN
ncbi:unnamed protein product [Thlaspi arvense]|uniref:SKP1-like protein n=1 Tax=Thlaspi arvense TaxID=13288 RepID=A0AAU9R922_THLAR|nr:unnamed protein product [Thlaspi arvense]